MLRKAVIKPFTKVCYNPSVTLRVPPSLAQGRLSLAPHSVIILPDKSVFVIYSKIKVKGKKDETSKRHGYDSYFFRSEPAGMGAKGGHSEAITEKKYMSYTHG